MTKSDIFFFETALEIFATATGLIKRHAKQRRFDMSFEASLGLPTSNHPNAIETSKSNRDVLWRQYGLCA
jgi:hypothetical protein